MSYDDAMTDALFDSVTQTRNPSTLSGTGPGMTAIYGRRRVPVVDTNTAGWDKPNALTENARATLLVWPDAITILPNAEGQAGQKRLVYDFKNQQTFCDDRSKITTLALSDTATERWNVELLATTLEEKEALAIRIADYLLPGDRNDYYYSKADVWSAKQLGVPELNVEDMYR